MGRPLLLSRWAAAALLTAPLLQFAQIFEESPSKVLHKLNAKFQRLKTNDDCWWYGCPSNKKGVSTKQS